MRLSALVLLFSSALVAQEISHTTTPHLLSKVEPEYTPEARAARLEGAVILRIVIDTDGKPRDARIMRGLGLGLDEKAVAAVGAWQFQPATKEGKPIASEAQIEVNFRLLNVKWHLEKAEFYLPEESVRPIISKVEAPDVAEGATNAAATITFDISKQGVPFSLHVERTSDEAWSRSVTTALSMWMFTPASRDGHPVLASCTMDFVRGPFQ